VGVLAVSLPLWDAAALHLADVRLVRETEAKGAHGMRLTRAQLAAGLALAVVVITPGLVMLGGLAWGLFLR
jgi:hypothetical protein